MRVRGRSGPVSADAAVERGSDAVVAAQVDRDKCTGCGTCVEICPVAAITVDDVAAVDVDQCVECAACVEACPAGAIVLPG